MPLTGAQAQYTSPMRTRLSPCDRRSANVAANRINIPNEDTTMDENKKRALSAALGQIEKQFGKGSVMRMGDKAVEPAEVIGTGSLMLDIALGIGGLPKGRVVEIYGPESSGKTTLTLQTIAAVPEGRRHRRLHRRRARARSDLRAEAGRQHRRPAGRRSPTPASRRWKSPTCWCVPTAVDMVVDRLGRRADAARPRSRARWATSCPACRRA